MKPRAKLMAFVLTLAAVLVAAATLVLISVPATAAEAAAATVAIDPARGDAGTVEAEEPA